MIMKHTTGNCIEYTESWCQDNYLVVNVTKTKELIFRFRKFSPDPEKY